jgi:hypothetical protein
METTSAKPSKQNRGAKKTAGSAREGDSRTLSGGPGTDSLSARGGGVVPLTDSGCGT